MKKKPPEKVKPSSFKHLKNKMVKPDSAKVIGMKRPGQRERSLSEDPQLAQIVQNYEAGLRAMQERKFEKAKGLFQKVVSGTSKELADRARVHLNACDQHMAKSSISFKTLEEHYDYSISLMNIGDYVTAREHLEELVKKHPGADYVWYGLAVLECLTGHVEDSLKRLGEAIRLNPANRFQARSDADFNNMADDPRFTELLYPEPTDSSTWNQSGSPR